MRGFTLVELLISMGIFLMFTTILLNSYVSIVTSQREADDYRKIYSEGRKVFQLLSDEVRNGVIDTTYQDSAKLVVYSKDGGSFKSFFFNETDKSLTFEGGSSLLSDEVLACSFSFKVFPSYDSYSPELSGDEELYQPLVLFYGDFALKKEGTLDVCSAENTVKVSLRTAVSSRHYGIIPKKDFLDGE